MNDHTHVDRTRHARRLAGPVPTFVDVLGGKLLAESRNSGSNPARVLAAFVLACGLLLGACSSGQATLAFDAGGTDAGDVGAIDASEDSDSAAPDTGTAGDTTPPAALVITARTAGVNAIEIDWTSVGDDGNVGTAAAYDLRYATTPIANRMQFAAATAVPNLPAPAAPGVGQTFTVTGLSPGTTYHFAMRARDEVPNLGLLSNDASAATLPRAQLQISEVAVTNGAADGYDFIELVALTPGRTDGLVIKESSTVLYTLSPLTLAAGDRLVLHAGNPCAAGCAQEDVVNNAAASVEPFAGALVWDLYYSTSGLSGADSVIAVFDGAQIVDAVALSNRDADATLANMNAFAGAATANAWVFGAMPNDGVNDCATQRDAVAVSTTDTACGGYATATGGVSIQRVAVTDTNQKKDFYAAPQTMGTANASNPPPSVASAAAVSSTQIKINFNDEIAASTIAPGVFTIAGLTVTAAIASDANEVTLTTGNQLEGSGYVVTVGSAVTDLQGTALVSPASASFCGYSTAPLALVINEVAPNVTTNFDLIELRAKTGGSISGVTLRSNPPTGNGVLLATFPSICIATGDLIVVHLNPAGAAGAAPGSETMSKTEYPSATYSASYDGAWDIHGTNNGVPFSDQVLAVLSGTTFLDAVAFTNTSGTTIAAFQTALAAIQAGAAWQPPTCGGAACTDATTPTAEGVSTNWSTVGTSPTGSTIARNAAGTDTDAAVDFTVGPSTLGNAN